MSKIRDAVHIQVEQKIAAGEALEAATALEREARDRLQEAERATQAARAAALREGWSERELRSLGLLSPARRRRPARTTKSGSEVQGARVE